jgi:fructokinase
MSEMKTPKVEVSDTVGAGDSFTAVMTFGLLAGKSLKEIHRSAIEISAFVCTRTGAMPDIPKELVSGISQ